MTTARQNGRSKLVSVRLPHEMIKNLKRLADKLGRPYQAVMKDAIERGIPIVTEIGMTGLKLGLKKDTSSYRALNVDAAVERLRKTLLKPKKAQPAA
jgi:ribbon-helix-helix CopG family protein